MIPPSAQLAEFRTAVALLGGQAQSAALLGLKEGTLRAYHSGARALTVAVLQRMARALIRHADACRLAERRLSPAFAANLTETQRTRRPPPWALPAHESPAP